MTEIIADTRTLQNSRASDWLRISAGNWPDRICYATDTESYTFAEIESRVNRLATSLQGLGVHKGSRVALFATDSPRYMEILLACMKLGAVYVPLNFRLARPELETLLRASESQVLFFSDRYRELVEAVDAPTLEYRVAPFEAGAGVGARRQQVVFDLRHAFTGQRRQAEFFDPATQHSRATRHRNSQ